MSVQVELEDLLSGPASLPHSTTVEQLVMALACSLLAAHEPVAIRRAFRNVVESDALWRAIVLIEPMAGDIADDLGRAIDASQPLRVVPS